MILNLFKREGETPLQRINRYKAENPEFVQEKMTYAGRLDPMAQGVLIVLTGEDVHKKDEFLHLDKTYEFEVLWRVSSDTYDILGEVIFGGSEPKDEHISEDVGSFIGSVEIPYPAYSSKTVGGKPMWSLARTGELSELEFPKRSMTIKKLKFIGSTNIEGTNLLSSVEERISKIVGDFRQEEILLSWREGIKSVNEANFTISRFVADVSSGTYIRSLAVRLGEKYNTRALAWKINRVSVGGYNIKDAV